MTSIRWWPGPGPLAPSLLFPFTGKSRGGAVTEVLIRRGFVTSMVGTRVEAARCRRCTSVAFRADDERNHDTRTLDPS